LCFGVQACAVPKQIAILRAPDGMEREEFVEALGPSVPEAELYVTDAGPRAATAIVCGPRIDGGVGSLLASYDVDDHVLWDEPIEGPVHSMFAFFRSPAGLAHDEFVKRYREHAEVARVHHPGIRRYVQDIVTSQTAEDRWMFDAISELHFAGVSEFEGRFWLTDQSRDVVARDVERFSEASTSKMVVAPRISPA
jgi:hypothetical protein